PHTLSHTHTHTNTHTRTHTHTHTHHTRILSDDFLSSVVACFALSAHLPIYHSLSHPENTHAHHLITHTPPPTLLPHVQEGWCCKLQQARSEERRVGKEWRSRWS